MSIAITRLRSRAVIVAGALLNIFVATVAVAQRTEPHHMGAMADSGMATPLVPSPLGISMDRMGSGTTWIPDAAPLPSRQFTAGRWEMMLHGFVFGEYDDQAGPRGDSQLGSLNWGMFMASHALGGGRFQARTMLSLDPWSVSPRGYPLLLQTGESFHGDPLHDRQHPHDFWMEVGTLYERAVTKRLGVQLYVAPSGEPALGPVAFMHRPSAMDNPLAPIGHHWQDATHIAFGVVTAGLFTRTFKLEASAFNGREPDDARWDFDPIRLNSYSTRATFNPNAHWSLEAGYGYLKSPERLTPGEDVHRITASVLYGRALGDAGQWATSAIYGANIHSGATSGSALIESEAVLDSANTVLGRAEIVSKSAEDLVLDTPQFGFPPDRRFSVGQLSLGYIRELTRWRGATVGLGALGTMNYVPDALRSAYGSRTPLGAVVFLRVRPAGVGMTGMPSMGSMHHEM